MRGGERVLEQILQCYPEADIFTHVLDPARVSDQILSHKITESFVGRFPGAKKHYQKYLGLMPRALEELDLTDYDLIISSESGPAKGVLAPPHALHVCYCHTPMRYIYDHYPKYRASLGPIGRRYFSQLTHRLRQWDFASAARVDSIIANSSFTASRIRRYWGRTAQVVHPPVDLELYSPGPAGAEPYYLAVSELVGYKRMDLAIDAFRGTGKRLVIVGDGEQRAALMRRSSDEIEFRGRVSNGELRDLYRGAKALIFPGEEDFGIVPVEAMACGLPVIAYGSGGALDTVRDGQTGTFFAEADPVSLRGAVEKFETMHFDRDVIVRHAQGFSNEAFRSGLLIAIDEAANRQSLRSAAE
ncbi:glycosyltransferase [Paracoccus sp. MBLB3053]|uniref:Glycosyltransferase n=1 Tax=Paracoccus aurantius TaxID=3073814 RepID=A0ABU2HW21_9RHOB|nr:glycosyltransferase [Paracoccus sp. MBLB3053]MDS9468932.1 glycosyltransferase [Paracoccus sp. MBLB3053]